MSVQHIHTQAQALVELERQRAARRASYARRKERTLNDPEYRKQVLQSRKISRDKKRQAIEDDPLHVDVRKDADRKAKVRRVARETQDILNTQD